MLRIIPFVMLLYFVSFLDRVNVGFAALSMNKAIGLSPTAFGLGGGLFFIGYFLFEVPSNLILHKVGARRWIARVMVSWGIVPLASAKRASSPVSSCTSVCGSHRVSAGSRLRGSWLPRQSPRRSAPRCPARS